MADVLNPSGHPVAVVTGAGSGIGRAVAAGLAGAGFDVVLVGRRPEPLAETAEMVDGSGQTGSDQTKSMVAVPTDVTDESSVLALFAAVEDRYGRVDLLFNNAGRGAPAVPFDQTGLDDWQAVVEVNLTGMFLCAREAFRLMRRQDPAGGRIINNGSISAHTPRPHAAAYTTTKHGVTGLTKQIALDGRSHRITCGQIDIGNAASEMTARMSSGVLQADGETRPEPTMGVDAVVHAVLMMATLPPDAAVLDLTVMAPGMPFVGRG